MKSAPPARRPQEIELKLLLLTSDPAGLEKRLARLPVLARRKACHQQLHSTYFDTPEQTLRRQRVALRLRRMGSAASPAWCQTLKTGGGADSALSRRGEWESAVPGAALDLAALEGTPWSALDPEGRVFGALAPAFVSSFERTSWTVRQRDGSAVEVSLDIGQLLAHERSLDLCELELELLAGQPAALFTLAHQIARSLAVMPETCSKAERGYALLEGSLPLPRRAQPVRLHATMAPAQAAQCVLREMLGHFTANLITLHGSQTDDPEVLHQARVGWRRFKSACRLFRPVLALGARPSWAPLDDLLALMGELRDLDVARTQTLPPLARAYTAGDTQREEQWQAMTQTLAHAAGRQRQALCDALEVPAVGAALLGLTQWLQAVAGKKAPEQAIKKGPEAPLRRWARRRIKRLHRQFRDALQAAPTPQGQHRVRILAKRIRYGIEALRALLGRRRSKRWYEEAMEQQVRIGLARDMAQAATVLARLEVDQALVAFVRGVAIGQQQPPH